MRFVINDVPQMSDSEAQEIASRLQATLLCARLLSQELAELPIWRSVDPTTTVVALPGAGAQTVVEFFPIDTWRVVHCKASRFWHPGMNPCAVAEPVTDKLDTRTLDVIVLDDVISSGVTMRKLHERSSPWMPRARWHAVTWIRQTCAGRLAPAYATTSAAFQVPNLTGGKLPINSISTLLSDEQVFTSYAHRHALKTAIISKRPSGA